MLSSLQAPVDSAQLSHGLQTEACARPPQSRGEGGLCKAHGFFLPPVQKGSRVIRQSRKALLTASPAGGMGIGGHLQFTSRLFDQAGVLACLLIIVDPNEEDISCKESQLRRILFLFDL